MEGLEDLKNQFTGLPMKDLIGGPLEAACTSQVKLAQATADFIKNVGFYDENGVTKTRVADFSFKRHKVTGQDELGHDIIEDEDVSLSVPMLAIVNVPSLQIDEVDITFDMEVKSSTSHTDTSSKSGSFSGSGRVGWGPFSVSVSISGSIASHQENTRKSDNSAKYHVAVHASQMGTPEGLSRVLDIIASSVAPQAVDSPAAKKDKQKSAQLDPKVRELKRLKNDGAQIDRDMTTKTNQLEFLKKNETAKSDSQKLDATIQELNELDQKIPDIN